MRVVMWYMAHLVLMAGPVGVVTLVVIMSLATTVPAYVEGFASLGVMAAVVTPSAQVFIKLGVIGPGVVKVVITTLDFVCSHELS